MRRSLREQRELSGIDMLALRKQTFELIKTLGKAKSSITRTPAGVLPAEISHVTGGMPEQIWNAIRWLRKHKLIQPFNEDYTKSKQGWTAEDIPESVICWEHGFMINNECIMCGKRKGETNESIAG